MYKINRILHSPFFKIPAGILYTIIASEILLRILSPVPIIPRYVTGSPIGIRVNIPNKSYWHKTADFTINIRTNSKGIRADEDIPYEKPAGIKRIVVLGDSFSMGYEVNLEDSFLVRMKENLEKVGNKIQLINLSVSGYGNAEELIILENEGLKYEPDIVLLCWHVSDYNDNIRSNLYILENGVIKRNAKTYLPGIKISDMLYKIPLFILVSENSHLYNWTRDEAGRKTQMVLAKFINMQLILKRSSTQSDDVEKKDNNYAENLSIAILNRIDNECKKHNAKFIVLDIPVQISRFEFISHFPNIHEVNYPVVSPIEIFNSNINKNELLAWEHSHNHFTPKGCRLVGRTLSEYILKNKILD